MRALVTAALVLTTSRTAVAANDAWAALADRLLASYPDGDVRVVLGAEPPRFVFPLPSRPALPVIGSTWFAPAGGPPSSAHVYYAPASHAGAAAEALYAQLRAAGYREARDPDEFPSFGPEQPGTVHHMCPADLERPAIDVRIDRVDGLPAMDLAFEAHAVSSSVCRDLLVVPDLTARMPSFTALPGVTFSDRFVPRGSIPGSQTFRTATVRTSLSPGDAVAAIAERFVAKGWTARPAAVSGRTITQRFTVAGTARRLNVLLAFDRRAEGVYDVVIAFEDTALGAAAP